MPTRCSEGSNPSLSASNTSTTIHMGTLCPGRPASEYTPFRTSPEHPPRHHGVRKIVHTREFLCGKRRMEIRLRSGDQPGTCLDSRTHRIGTEYQGGGWSPEGSHGRVAGAEETGPGLPLSQNFVLSEIKH